MNQIKKVLIGVALLVGVAVTNAQQTNNPETGFFTQVFQWGTSFNTNSTTFLATRAMLDTGVESRMGDGLALINDIHMSYDVVGATYSAPTNISVLRFGPDLVERNSGVTGTFVSVEAGPQVAVIIYDFRIGLAVDGGYWANSAAVRHHLFGEACLDADKAIGSRTYMGLRFSQEFPRNAQGVYVKAGFTF